MTLEEILNIKMDGKIICLFGSPGSGKTYLSNVLAAENAMKIFHSDDYINYGYEDAVYYLMEDITKYLWYKGNGLIVEGVQVPRLLRKGHELGNFKADILIICERDWADIVETYHKERNPDKIKYLMKFHTQNQAILQQTLNDLGDSKPQIIYFDNHF